MAQKKIGDLQLRSSFDATVEVPGDDSTQTWKVSGTQIRDFLMLKDSITGLTEDTAPASDDLVWTSDTSAAASKKVQLRNLFKKVYRSVVTTDSPTIADDILALSGASFVVTLPTAVGCTGKVFTLLHLGTSVTQVYTLNTTSAQTIGGIASGSYKLITAAERLVIVSDGANWQILSHIANTDPVSFTPSGAWSSNTTYTGFWHRRGRFMVADIKLALAGAPTSATLTVNVPLSLTIDTSFMNIAFGSETPILLGSAWHGSDNGVANYDGFVYYSSTTVVKPKYMNVSASIVADTSITQASPFSWGNTDGMGMTFQIPITDWQP